MTWSFEQGRCIEAVPLMRTLIISYYAAFRLMKQMVKLEIIPERETLARNLLSIAQSALNISLSITLSGGFPLVVLLLPFT